MPPAPLSARRMLACTRISSPGSNMVCRPLTQESLYRGCEGFGLSQGAFAGFIVCGGLGASGVCGSAFWGVFAVPLRLTKLIVYITVSFAFKIGG